MCFRLARHPPPVTCAILAGMKYQPTYPYVLFDLDGTLTDSAPGIIRSLVYAFGQSGVPVPPESTLYTWLGPPLEDTLTAHLGSAEAAQQMILRYRERYIPIGMYENSVYAGMAELLADLHAAGAQIALATSKPHVYAKPIVTHFGLLPYFTYVGGATLNGRITTKAEVIGDVLHQLGNPDPAQCVMIGDRLHDVEGARHYHLPVIAVRHGYAPAGELEAAAPDAIVADAAELRPYLLTPHLESQP